MSIEVISGFIGLILTLLVFSYLIGDNPLFRFAIYLFIGVSSGYAAFAAWQYVLWPKLFSQLGDVNQLILLAVPLVLSISLLAKLSRVLHGWGILRWRSSSASARRLLWGSADWDPGAASPGRYQ